MAAAMLVGATVQAASWQALACLSEFEFSHADCDAFDPAWGKGATFIRVTVWGTLIAALLYLARASAKRPGPCTRRTCSA